MIIYVNNIQHFKNKHVANNRKKAILHIEIKLITEMINIIFTAFSSIIWTLLILSSTGNMSRLAETSHAYKRRHLYEVNISIENVDTLNFQMYVTYRY